ncbi:bestrophin family ion channel [Buttiauxella gaviniae]|uniref:Bestrophin family ion channel n=1 Tax=Buttiauxella gaviniae TaxID=82990 RepID=A0ABV3NQL0_9ENTR
MIVRPEQHWFRRLFSWRGSIMRKISYQLLFFFMLNIVYLFVLPLLHMHGIDAKESPVGFIGISISIFLGFRNNAAWIRYSEARKLWGDLLITARSLMREIKSTTQANQEEMKVLLNFIVCYCNVLKSMLRHERIPVEVTTQTPYMYEKLNVATPCNALLQEIGTWLFRHKRNALDYQNFNHYLNNISTIQGGCERISNTPIPFAYSLILHRTVYIYCTIYPLLIIDSFGFLSLLFSLFTTYALLALDAIATELEDPFGREDNDLPLNAICNTIEIDLLEMIHEGRVPEKITPDKNYRLL